MKHARSRFGLRGFWRRYQRDTSGAAAAEFALWVTVLTVPVYNVVDISFYTYQHMQVENAAQVAAQAVWQLCNTSAKLPATRNCANLTSALTSAAQSTSLGTGVTLPTGSPTEGYYCVNGSNALVLVGAVTAAAPSSCSAFVAGNTSAPGDYAQVQVSYTYTPAFPGVSVVSLLATPIVKTAWMRLN